MNKNLSTVPGADDFELRAKQIAETLRQQAPTHEQLINQVALLQAGNEWLQSTLDAAMKQLALSTPMVELAHGTTKQAVAEVIGLKTKARKGPSAGGKERGLKVARRYQDALDEYQKSPKLRAMTDIDAATKLSTKHTGVTSPSELAKRIAKMKRTQHK